MDSMNTNETVELADLEPTGEVKGGISGSDLIKIGKGELTLGANSTSGATQGRGQFTISTDRIGPQ